LASEFPPPSPDGQRRSSGGPPTCTVSPRGREWIAERDGDLVFAGSSPIDAAHHARLDLAERGGGLLVVLDSAGRHFKRFVVDASS